MNYLPKNLALIAILLPILLVAQKKDTIWRPLNLVINNSFESHIDSTKSFNREEHPSKALGWSVPNKSLPSIFSTDTKGHIYSSGESWLFKARTGKNVAGLNIYHANRDYIQGTLIKPLEVGKKYYFAFFVHYHCSSTNNIGIVFLPSKVSLDSNSRIPLIPATYQKELIPYKTQLKSEWQLVKDSFIAQMSFKHFIIGNFFADEETKTEKGVQGHYCAYIDDVAVWKAQNQPTYNISSKKDGENWLQNSAFVIPKNVAINLSNIYFNFNSAELNSRSNITLDSLVDKMRLVATIKIRINGHTSSEGNTDSKQKLSEKRAISVKNYLIAHGIDSNRITSAGLGDSQPIAPNDTEDNKKYNRRVEFIRTE